MKYKQRDELVERLELWKTLSKDEKFLTENCFEFRDLRLRRLYKERYDVRKNLIDADLVWGIHHCKLPVRTLIQN